MQLKLIYDYYKRLKQSRLFLANPQKNYIGTLGSSKHLQLTMNFNNMSEISFIIYEEENGDPVSYYKKVENKRLIHLEYIGWFQITRISEKQDSDSKVRYKEVKCLSLENELIGKKVHDINGVFALYDVVDTSKSLLHIFTQNTGWTIGHVDNELIGKWRTFSIDSIQVYNGLTTDISKSFECVFIFDTFSKTINAYKLSNIGKLTDIVISRRNILKDWIKESSADDIITKLTVLGADNVDIRAVNPTGMNYIVNVDYFMTPEWASQSLIDAWNIYKVKYNNVTTTYQNTLAQLKTYQAELTTLKAQLTDLQSLQKSKDIVVGTFIEKYNGTPPNGSNDYTLYLNAINASASFTPQIVNKKAEITAKENQIVTVQNSLAIIGDGLDASSNFTSDQIAELNIFLTENDEYQDSTFVISETMTDEEVTNMKLELMQNGDNELARASQPQFTIKTTASNLFSIRDDVDSPISYDEWRQDCEVGNLITIKFRDDYWTTVRLISMTIDFDDLENIDLTFSDKSRFDSELIQLGEVIAQSERTSNSLSLNKFGYDKASAVTSDVREFMNGTLNATTNAMVNNDFVETEIGRFGIKNKQWLPDQNKYSDYQSWWNQNTLLFSSDGFKTSKAGIGLFTNGSGEKFYGVIGDVIVGQLIIGSGLTISNTSGTYTINNNGFTATNGIYSVGLNPSTPSEIINVKISGVNQLYIDTVNKKLVYKGNLEAVGGTFSGNLSAAGGTFKGTLQGVDGTFSGTISAGTITGSTISGGTISGTTLTGTTINGGTLNIGSGNFTVSNTGDFFAKTATFGGNTYKVTANNDGIAVTDLSSGRIVSRLWANSVYGDYVLCDHLSVETLSGITAGGQGLGTLLASKNHGHSSTDINAVLTSGENIAFGSKNAASVTWVDDNFQRISASDFRLKKNIQSLSLPDELFMDIKTKQFEFKINTYGHGINLGVLAQELESSFQRYELNPFDYNIVELGNVRTYTDEGLYVDDFVHRVNYNNFIPWLINIVQKQQLRINNLEEQIIINTI